MAATLISESLSTVEGVSLAQAWEASIRMLVGTRRARYDGSVGGPYQEARNMIITCTDPSAHPAISDRYRFKNLLASAPRDEALEELLEIRRRIEAWPSSTGQLVNQLDMAFGALERNLFSRRAVLVLWNPALDYELDNAICPCYVQFYARPDGDAVRLNCLVVVRSSDAWMGAMTDMWLFSRIQAQLARRLDVELGHYIHHAVSYHIYEQDIPAARQLLVRDQDW